MSNRNKKVDGLEVNVFWLRDARRTRISKADSRIGRGNPVTLVAYVVKGDDILYATSTHNPKDKFNRTNAHNAALGKLKGTDTHVRVHMSPESEIGPEATIVDDIVSALALTYGPTAHTRRMYTAALATYPELLARHRARIARNAEKAAAK